jgi:hypothetical protein
MEGDKAVLSEWFQKNLEKRIVRSPFISCAKIAQ